jgi:small subunit ribosomal protein S21
LANNLTIYVNQFASFETALKRFKKRIDKLGVLSEFLSHQYFESPSRERYRRKRMIRRKQQQPSIKR